MSGSVSILLASAWIPFVVSFVLIVLFSWFYVIKYRSRYDSECSITSVNVISLVVALLTLALVPVDVFSVSFFKNSDGTFKDWANSSEVRDSIQNDILYTYYAMYAVLLVLMFFVIPLQYFYYEEDDDSTVAVRCCSAFKYTFVFLIIAAILMLTGAFIPLKDKPPPNSTEFEKIQFLFSELGNDRGLDSLSFILSVICLIGMLCMLFYTGYGMASWPIGLIKGFRRATGEHQEVIAERNSISSRVRSIQDRYDGSYRRISRRDMNQIASLEESDRLLQREQRHLENATRSVMQKCYTCIRPFQLIFGILIALVGLLIFISLMLSNIDKAMHSLGYQTGYTLPKRYIVNPIDYLLVHAEAIFPMDYLLYAGLILFFVFATMSGLRNLGIWFLWLRLYKIRPSRTRPQGLLMAVFILIFIILALNVIIFSITPVYTMYGNQHYVAYTVDSKTNKTISHVKQCDTEASADDCLLTRGSMLLIRFFYKAWYFGAAYYWCTWVFLLVMVIGAVAAIYVQRRSSIDGQVDDSDFEESDDELITA